MSMFDSLNQFNILIMLGILAIIVEIILGAVTGFELLIIGIVFVIGGVVGMLTGSMMFAIVAIIILTLGYIFFARKMIKQVLHITTTKTNTDSIIGEVANVVADIKISAPGQVKIEGEIWRAESTKDISKGKKVKIRGEVVKYSEAIMNTNWVHIQDGTSFNDKYDLTITTKMAANVQDIVTFEGVVVLNKDFGYGYFYEVLIENAAIVN